MKLTKSLVKKGGKKSLKKTLKMRKSKKGGKKSLKNRKMRKTMKGGTKEDDINRYKGNIDEYKKVYDILHSKDTPPSEEEKLKIDSYILGGLQPKLVKSEKCYDKREGHVYVGIDVDEGAALGSFGNDKCVDDYIQLNPEFHKIVEDPGSFSMKKRYLFKADNPFIGSYQDFEFDASKFDSSNYYGGKKSLNTKKARKSRKMKGGTVYDCSDEYQDDETKKNRIKFVTERASKEGKEPVEEENMYKVRKEGDYEKTAVYYKKALIPGRGKTMTCYVPGDQEKFMTPS